MNGELQAFFIRNQLSTLRCTLKGHTGAVPPEVLKAYERVSEHAKVEFITAMADKHGFFEIDPYINGTLRLITTVRSYKSIANYNGLELNVEFNRTTGGGELFYRVRTYSSRDAMMNNVRLELPEGNYGLTKLRGAWLIRAGVKSNEPRARNESFVIIQRVPARINSLRGAHLYLVPNAVIKALSQGKRVFEAGGLYFIESNKNRFETLKKLSTEDAGYTVYERSGYTEIYYYENGRKALLVKFPSDERYRIVRSRALEQHLHISKKKLRRGSSVKVPRKEIVVAM
jgi:hypothetical protein